MIDNFEVAKTLLAQNGEITSVTVGGSMKPLFRSGKDRALVIPITQKLKVGDVLLYKSQNGNDLTLHRVIKLTKNGPVLRGDSLFFKETNIPQNHIIGILKGFWRNEKYYDCHTHFGYRLYVFYILTSYPVRRLFKKFYTAYTKLKNLLEK